MLFFCFFCNSLIGFHIFGDFIMLSASCCNCLLSIILKFDEGRWWGFITNCWIIIFKSGNNYLPQFGSILFLIKVNFFLFMLMNLINRSNKILEFRNNFMLYWVLLFKKKKMLFLVLFWMFWKKIFWENEFW